MTFCRAVRGRAGWNEGPQRRDVGGQLGACGAAPGTQGVLDLSLQAGKPRFQVTAGRAAPLPLRFNWLIRRRRSTAASGVLIAACTIGTSVRGRRNKVRRMAIQRTRLRRSYIAADTSARLDVVLRASIER